MGQEEDALLYPRALVEGVGEERMAGSGQTPAVSRRCPSPSRAQCSWSAAISSSKYWGWGRAVPESVTDLSSLPPTRAHAGAHTHEQTHTGPVCAALSLCG